MNPGAAFTALVLTLLAYWSLYFFFAVDPEESDESTPIRFEDDP